MKIIKICLSIVIVAQFFNCSSSTSKDKKKEISKKIESLRARSNEKIKSMSDKSTKKNTQRNIIKPVDKTPSDNQLPIIALVYAQNDSSTIIKSLESILTQDYENFHITCIVDNSTDHTVIKIHQLNETLPESQQIELKILTEPAGKLQCLYSFIHECPDTSIIVPIEARDWLINESVFNNLCKEYREHDTWLTFGSATSEPHGCNIGVRNGVIPSEIMSSRTFRKIFPYMPAHSFYAWLFKKIDKQDLIDPLTNNFFEHATECYIMWPMVEMACTHVKAFSEITYVLNCNDPIRRLTEDYYLRMACNSQMGRQLPVYQSLVSPF